ncbi:MAG: hypothetical protein ABIG55_06600 [Candidatus Omnitrophota bacterium]|nr:hypothetical protein [Candidatus Omnitrophota bacterium]
MSKKDDIKCVGCYEKKACRDTAGAWVFLFIGILAAVAMRAVILFMHINPVYAKTAWYVGMSFFFVFFIYRYNISREVYGEIIGRQLIKKLREKEELSESDREAVAGILCGLTSNKERINFIVIFVLSGIALIGAAAADIIMSLK